MSESFPYGEYLSSTFDSDHAECVGVTVPTPLQYFGTYGFSAKPAGIVLCKNV